MFMFIFFFFFQAEDGIRDSSVTGVQTCALPIYHGRDAAFVSDAAFDAFRHELLGGVRREAVEVELVLKVPIAAAAAHRADRPHAAVLFEAASLIQNHLARALVGAREQIADHRRARADR